MRSARWVVPAVVATLVSAGCTGSPTPSLTPEHGITGADSPTQTVDPADREAFAVWPEDVRSDAEAAQERVAGGADPWRADPEATALEFVAQVLGWQGATAEVGAKGSRDGCVRVTRPDGERAVDVGTAELVDGAWSVVTVFTVENGEIEDYRLAYGIAGARASGTVDLLDEPGATLTFAFGGRERSIEIAPPGEFDVDLGFAPATSGHYLLVFTEDGEVAEAQASPLPAGDSAAS